MDHSYRNISSYRGIVSCKLFININFQTYRPALIPVQLNTDIHIDIEAVSCLFHEISV